MGGRQRLVVFLVIAASLAGWRGASLAKEQPITCKEAPAAVLAAFANAYPRATIKGCAREEEKGQTVYELASVEGKTRRDVTYSADGKPLSVEEAIDLTGLPAGVKAAFNKRFPHGKILSVETVTKGDIMGYEFRIRNEGRTREIVFDAEGNELKM